jgi:microcystin-dependent protein
MANPFLAEIRVFAFGFAPRGWATCSGQILPISQNTALFSLLGTTYGGDGRSNFALPNLNGRVPMHPGQGPGLQPRYLGEQTGEPAVTLLEAEIPSHNHRVAARTGRGKNKNTPEPGIALADSQGNFAFGPVEKEVNTNPTTLKPNGGGLPHNNMMPYLALNYCIALQGVYPQRP